MPADAAVRHSLVRGLLLAAGLAGVTGAAAQSRWMHSLTVPLEMEYDSNPSMAPGASPGGTLWLRLAPGLATKYVHGNEEFVFEGALSAQKSSNTAVAQDRLDPRLRAAWKHTGPLDTTELAALYERSAFRDTEVRQQVPLGVDGTRTLTGLTGSWVRDLDARTSFNTEVRQEWERSDVGVTPDFSRTTGLARIKRAQDERTSWYAGINAQTVRPDRVTGTPGVPVQTGRSTVAGALFGIERDFSEALRVDASIGPVRFLRPQTRNDWQAAATAEYTAPRWQAGVDVLRAPSVDAAAGGLAVTEELRVRVRYDLDALSHLQVEAGGARENSAGSSRTLASVRWVRDLSPSWQFTVKATFQRQEGAGGTAISKGIGVALVYNMPDL